METIKGAQLITQNEINMGLLRPGDHIFTRFIKRSKGFYSHHGIYVGHGMVIHFVPVWPLKDGTEFPNPGPCEKCQGFNGGHHIIGVYGKVVTSCVGCFGNQIYLYRYGVSWPEALLNPSTCCPYKSKPLDEAVKTANEKLNTGFGGYDPTTNNCEHFATFCRTGIKYSLLPIFEKFGDKVPELPVDELGKIAAGTNVSVAVM